MRVRVLVFVVLLLAPVVACACAASGRPGERIEIADESAIIIWDAASKVQHFIRRASFQSGEEVKDFGFLVPTPSYPQLAEADDKAFGALQKLTSPRTITRRRTVSIGCAGSPGPRSKDEDVQVLHEQRVAGYDAVVLEAKGADALANWLAKHGYEFGEHLREWARPYIDQGWKITAFKVARDEKGERLATSAVRMSFPTARPFFPYREPAEAPQPQRRLLRVYFVADARYQGTLPKQEWPGRVAWSGSVGAEDRAGLLKQLGLPADTGPKEWRLTEFEDRSAPRPGHDDLHFGPDANQGAVERRPRVVYTAPREIDYVLAVLASCSCCCVPFLALAGVWWLVRWRRRTPTP